MNILVHNRKKPDDGSIKFPALQCWNPETKVATIVAEVGGRRVTCRVKVSDLRKKFRIFTDDPMRSVSNNRDAIEKAAAKRIRNHDFEDDGSVLIQYADL